VQEAQNAHAQKTLLAEQGWIGHILGSKAEKPGNVAAIVILLCFLLLGVGFHTMCHDAGNNEDFFKFVSIITGIIGLALGYLFGSSGSAK